MEVIERNIILQVKPELRTCGLLGTLYYPKCEIDNFLKQQSPQFQMNCGLYYKEESCYVV